MQQSGAREAGREFREKAESSSGLVSHGGEGQVLAFRLVASDCSGRMAVCRSQPCERLWTASS